jgi:hypothetical protein
MIAWGKFGTDSRGFLTDLLQRLRFLARVISGKKIERTNLDLGASGLTDELAKARTNCAVSSKFFRRITLTHCEGESIDSLFVPLEWNSVQEMVCCREALDQSLKWTSRRLLKCTRLHFLRLEVCQVSHAALQTLTSTPNLE